MTVEQMRERVVRVLAEAAALTDAQLADHISQKEMHVRRAALAVSVEMIRACGLIDDEYNIDTQLWQLLAEPDRRFMLVYQGGIANVFEVDSFNLSAFGRNAKRCYQGTFDGARHYCHGLARMGAIVRTASRNIAGDVANVDWMEGTSDCPFRDEIPDIHLNGGTIDDEFVRARVGRDVRVVLDDEDVIGRLDEFDGHTLTITQWGEGRVPVDIHIDVVRNLLVRG